MTDLANLSAVELIALYKKKALSPVEYFDWLEGHIAAWEPYVQALYLYRPDVGRAEAKASAARWSKGLPNGPLDGVPVTVKEIIATKGDPIPLGSAATKLAPATDDAPSVGTAARRWRDHLRENHLPGLRHAVVGHLKLPSDHAQSVGPEQESRRLVRPARVPQVLPDMAHCILAPISADRSGFRPDGAGCSG